MKDLIFFGESKIKIFVDDGSTNERINRVETMLSKIFMDILDFNNKLLALWVSIASAPIVGWTIGSKAEVEGWVANKKIFNFNLVWIK